MKVRLTYAKDIDREGADVIDVDPVRAQRLVRLRRAVIVPDAPAKKPAAKTAKRARKRG